MNRLQEQEIIGEAHGKLILVGEHIVVYNKPAIAIPFPLKICAGIKGRTDEEISIASSIYTGKLADLPGSMRGLYECIQQSLIICKKPRVGLHIDIKSEIPEGRGLGSSAAAATAIIRGIFKYFHLPLSQEELFSLVTLSETHAHGNPSGIDMVAVSTEEPILFCKPMRVASLTAPKAFHIIVADSGQAGATKKAVEHVRDLKMQRPTVIDNNIKQIEELVIKANKAILEGNSSWLGELLFMNHEKLKELEVSNPLLDHLVEVAIRSGALGAKLTGGGMGGCILALAKDIRDAEIISKELMNGGAKMAWCFSTDSNEIYRKG